MHSPPTTTMVELQRVRHRERQLRVQASLKSTTVMMTARMAASMAVVMQLVHDASHHPWLPVVGHKMTCRRCSAATLLPLTASSLSVSLVPMHTHLPPPQGLGLAQELVLVPHLPLALPLPLPLALALAPALALAQDLAPGSSSCIMCRPATWCAISLAVRVVCQLQGTKLALHSLPTPTTCWPKSSRSSSMQQSALLLRRSLHSVV